MKKNNLRTYIDSTIILLNLSSTYSIIPYLIFTSSRGMNMLLITIINIIYLGLRFKKISFPPIKHILFYLYILIYTLNAIFGTIIGDFSIGLIIYLFSNISFYIILYSLYKHYINDNKLSYNKSLNLLQRGYMWLCSYNIFIIIALFFLITFFHFNPYQNEIGSKMDLFNSNLQSFTDTAYYFPKYISVIYQSYDIRIPFFQSHGFITGLYHEPHIVTFILTPCLFLFLHKKTKLINRISIIISYILIILICASTMNIIAIAICVIISFILNKNRKWRITLIITTFLIGSIIIYVGIYHFKFITNRFYSVSANYTNSLIKFALSPHTMIGSNFLDLSYIDISYSKFNVGYIIFLLNILFLLNCYYRTYFLLKNKYLSFIGLFALYFFIHSIKLCMLTYQFSYLIFIIFILQISYEYTINEKKFIHSNQTNTIH